MEKIRKFHFACGQILEFCNNDYAKSYARAGLRMMDLEQIESQALYIYSNLIHWRHPIAKSVRATLKEVYHV